MAEVLKVLQVICFLPHISLEEMSKRQAACLKGGGGEGVSRRISLRPNSLPCHWLVTTQAAACRVQAVPAVFQVTVHLRPRPPDPFLSFETHGHASCHVHTHLVFLLSLGSQNRPDEELSHLGEAAFPKPVPMVHPKGLHHSPKGT